MHACANMLCIFYSRIVGVIVPKFGDLLDLIIKKYGTEGGDPLKVL